MNVVTRAEGADEVLVLAEVCHDAQLNLRVVGREEAAMFVGHEAAAYLFAIVASHRNVLQVGV